MVWRVTRRVDIWAESSAEGVVDVVVGVVGAVVGGGGGGVVVVVSSAIDGWWGLSRGVAIDLDGITKFGRRPCQPRKHAHL